MFEISVLCLERIILLTISNSKRITLFLFFLFREDNFANIILLQEDNYDRHSTLRLERIIHLTLLYAFTLERISLLTSLFCILFGDDNSVDTAVLHSLWRR